MKTFESHQPVKKIQVLQIQHAVIHRKQDRMSKALHLSQGQGKMKKRQEKGRAMSWRHFLYQLPAGKLA
jgi:hypothetical protein